MAILDNVKTDLRISNTSFDTEITTAISAAKKQLSMAGVGTVSDTDPLTEHAIKLYCRSWFNFQGDADRYLKAFDKTVNGMALSSDYEEEEDE